MISIIGGARLTLPFLLLIGACSGDQAAPGAPTSDEERQLNEAAEMLEANSVALDNLDDGAPQ